MSMDYTTEIISQVEISYNDRFYLYIGRIYWLHSLRAKNHHPQTEYTVHRLSGSSSKNRPFNLNLGSMWK